MYQMKPNREQVIQSLSEAFYEELVQDLDQHELPQMLREAGIDLEYA